MNLWVIFLTGLTVGGLTCLAVQGGLLASVIAAKEEEEVEKGINRKSTVFPTLAFLVAKLAGTEEKLDRLLEGYLDKIIESTDYKKKKNDLIQEKVSLQGKMKEISQNGVEWLELQFSRPAAAGFVPKNRL